MKNIILVFVAFLSYSAFAGRSLSGGPSEAPWVRSQDILGQVMQYFITNNLPISSMEFTRRNQVLAKIACDDGSSSDAFFDVVDSCTPTAIPDLCLPSRAVTLDQMASSACP